MAYIMSEKQKYLMSEPERVERERVKAIHRKLREPLRGGKSGDRYDLLAWAFARGFKLRRCERSHHVQALPDGGTHWHFRPEPWMIWERLVRAGALTHDRELPKFVWQEWYDRVRLTEIGQAITAWVDDSSGAIPASPPKAKKLYSSVAA